jgi:hypothetical protein
VRTLLRRVEREKKRGKGVVLAFYRGRGSAGEEMPVGNNRGFTADTIDGWGGC